MSQHSAHSYRSSRHHPAAKKQRLAGWAAIGVGALGYCILAIRQPAEWPTAVWAALALIAVPLLAGYAAGRASGMDSPPRSRFWKGFWAVGFAMFWYTAISLMYLRTRVAFGGRSEDIFLVGFFVSAVYAVIAGVFGGIGASKLAWMKRVKA